MNNYAIVGFIVGLILMVIFMIGLYIWMDLERKKFQDQQERMINNLADLMENIREKDKKITKVK